MLELIWSDRFEREVQAIYEWLERNEGRGDVFYKQLLVDLEQLSTFPWSGSRIEGGNARHLLVVGGRYAAIHMIEHRGIILHSLFDQRRDPQILDQFLREITGGLPGPPPIP